MYYSEKIYQRTTILTVLKFLWDLAVETLIGFLVVLLGFYLLGFRPYVVISGSMLPTLNVGDIIFVKANDDARYKIGDIVTFEETSGSITTHRVIEVQADGVRTQGDANNAPDGQLRTWGQIKGKTIFRLWKTGLIYAFFRDNLILSIELIALVWITVSALKNEHEYYTHPAGA